MTRLFAKVLAVALVGCTVAAVLGQVRDTAIKEPTDTLLPLALERLSHKVSPLKLESLRARDQSWTASSEWNGRDPNDFVAATDRVHELAAESNTRCEITVAATGGVGATIRYQTLGERRRNEPPTTAGTSTVTEKVYIGRYHVWAERNGRATSDKTSEYNLVDPKKRIVLSENTPR